MKGLERDARFRERSSLDRYLAEVALSPCLSVEDERELARAYRSTRDRQLAHRLVTSNLRFVIKIAREYRSWGLGLADLIQEGNVGLLTAVEKFDPDRGVRLVTYAAWRIRASIQDFILRSWSLVKIGAATRRDVEAMTARLASRDLSLDAPTGQGESAFRDLLADHRPLQEHRLSTAQEDALLRRRVGAALSRLRARERHIIEQRIMRDTPATLVDLGAELEISPQRSRELEGRARRKLTKELAGVAAEIEWRRTPASRHGRRARIAG